MKIAEVSSPRLFSCARVAALVLVFAWMAWNTQTAGAQDPGVVFEPGSPSYKEYSIPLEEARRDAGGGNANGIDSRAFGIGLSRRGADKKPARGRSGSKRSKSSRGRAAVDRDAAGSRRGAAAAGERLAEAEAAGAPSFWRFGVLLLVLIPGLLVGALLALRRDSTPAT
jgi:hypothetical protein